MGILSADQLKALKNVRRLSFLTCYDYQTALWMDRTSLDGVLVGDSLSQVIYGMDHTSDVNMNTMLAHTLAVRRGLKSIHLMGDMPYIAGSQEGDSLTKDVDRVKAEEETLSRALQLQEVGVDSIKIENPSSSLVEKILQVGIPVCGHIGLTPQTIHDFKKQGKDSDSAKKIFDSAIRLDQLGCFAILLEAIPEDLAQKITEAVSAITIGIASGKVANSQILVHYDLLGLTYTPKKFVNPQATWGEDLLQAVDNYIGNYTRGGQG